MNDTLVQFWKDKYNEADKGRSEYISLAARMTGYFSALAKYSIDMPKQERIRMLEQLIKLWNDVDPDSKLTQEWITNWEKEIKEISA